MRRVAVVSVCLNDEHQLPLFLESKRKWSLPGVQYILVDNGSTDRSVAMVRQACPDAFVILPGRNLGTTGGYNLGIARALEWGATYIMLLALDALLDEACVETLVRVLDTHADIGVSGPIVLKSHDRDVIESYGFALDRDRWVVTANEGGNRLRAGLPSLIEADYVDGGTAMFRSAALAQAGLFDERLFIYGEDQDLCLRIHEHGYRVVACLDAKAWHRHDELRGSGTRPRPHEVYYLSRNWFYLVRKHGSPTERRGYYRQLLGHAPRMLGYLAVRQRSPRLAAIYCEALLAGFRGEMGKTKYAH